jgi:type II secretory pathway component PulK
LRREGYRSENRITVFQTLVHTLGMDRSHIQTLLKAHNERNLAEYEGRTKIDAKLLADLIQSAKALEAEVGELVPSAED